MKIAGLPVVDSPKKLKIVITEKDVAKGNTKDPGSCAAAQACLRQPNCTQARVHLGRTYLKIGEKWVRFHTPPSLRGEIISFDRGAMFQPGEYTLAPMQPSHRAKGKRIGGPTVGKAKKKSSKARAKPHVVHGVRASGANR